MKIKYNDSYTELPLAIIFNSSSKKYTSFMRSRIKVDKAENFAIVGNVLESATTLFLTLRSQSSRANPSPKSQF